MNKFYFTFGQSHFTEDGVPMNDYYVTVNATDEISARIHFSNHFALPIMGRKDKWAFCYTDSSFNKVYFPNGEYDNLTCYESSELENPNLQECDATDDAQSK